MAFADESDKGSSRRGIAWAKDLLFACDLKIVEHTGYALLNAQALCFVKHATTVKAISTVIERIKKATVEVRDFKSNIPNNARGSRDDLTNEIFDR